MGGTIAVCFRNGPDIFKMHRWTNSMPGFVNHLGYITKDPGHAEDYIEQWRVLARDFEKNQATGHFEFPMTECYAPYPALLAPCGYGLVVFDWNTDSILTMQGYTGFGRLLGWDFPGPHHEVEEGSKALFEAGKLQHLHYWKKARGKDEQGRPNYDEVSEPVPAKYEELCATMHNRETGGQNLGMEARIEMNPHQIIRFEEGSVEALRAFQAALAERGFVLTDEEKQAWDDRAREIEEDD